MDPQLKKAAIRDFQEIREEFLARFKDYASGFLADTTVDQIQTELRRLRNTISMWSLIPGGLNKDHLTCFETRCNRIVEAIDHLLDTFVLESMNFVSEKKFTKPGSKVFEMLTFQLGRLTLEGGPGEDEKADEWAVKAEIQQRKWESRDPVDDIENEAWLRGIWTTMHFKSDDCPCSQCLNLFIPGSGYTPRKIIVSTPRVSPAGEDNDS